MSEATAPVGRAHRLAVEREAIPADVVALCERLVRRGYPTWIVGGCVRDHLMRREVSDWDLCTTATPTQVSSVFPRAIPTGIDHGTVTVMVGKTGYEVTTLRGETSYTDGRRPDAVFFVADIDADLARRDFTVNAMAYDPLHDVLVDPFDGVGDLRRSVLRAVGNPSARFAEDGLRVLRAARFVATLEFALDRATHDAIAGNVDTFRRVSAERVRDEWVKTMKAREPSRAFEVMRETGVLAAICPGLLALVGIAHGADGDTDVWTHTMRVLDAAPPGDVAVRMAALLHDLGRSRAAAAPGGGHHDEDHARASAEAAEAFLRAYRFSNDERARIAHLVRHHRVDRSPPATDAGLRRLVRTLGSDALEPLFRLLRADAAARSGSDGPDRAALEVFEHRLRAVLTSRPPLSTRDLAITGHDLQASLGLPPSRRLGEILTELLERVTDDPALNSREALLAIASALAGAAGNG